MSKLDAALAWAAKGFRVFPVRADTKFPLAGQGWTLSATTDPAVVRELWDGQDHNIGFLTDDYVVVDVDVRDGKRGLDTFMRLGLEFDTLTVRTPSGGWHAYYRGIERHVGSSPLGPDLDVRSYHGYVLAPGSTIGGVPYEVELDLAVAEFPVELRPLLKSPRSRRGADDVSVELDLPEATEMAAHWLRREAPPAIQGENGDLTTYRTACRVRDYGVSETTALDLMADEWNARCEPPWPPDELRLKVENAYRYATGAAGSASPAELFAGVEIVEPPLRVNGHAHDTIHTQDLNGVIRFGNMMREEDIGPRPWVVEGLLEERTVSLLVAPGGAGKSLLSLIVAAHLAVGRPFWNYDVRKPGKSIIYNAEDDLAEVSRRLIAVCRVYDLDEQEVSSRVCLLGRDDVKLKLTKDMPPVVNTEHVEMLVGDARDPEVVMLSVDPMISVHTARENDVTEMEFVMDVMRDVSRRANVPVLVVQHQAKAGNQSMSGNQDAARGSTAIAAAARVMLTLETARATLQDCAEIGITNPAECRRYVRLMGAKTSHAAADGGALWLRWKSHEIASGDKVGVLVVHDAGGARTLEQQRVARAVQRAIVDGGTCAVPLPHMVDLLASGEAVGMEAVPSDQALKLLKRIFATPVFVEGGTGKIMLLLKPEDLVGPHLVLR